MMHLFYKSTFISTLIWKVCFSSSPVVCSQINKCLIKHLFLFSKFLNLFSLKNLHPFSAFCRNNLTIYLVERNFKLPTFFEKSYLVVYLSVKTVTLFLYYYFLNILKKYYFMYFSD